MQVPKFNPGYFPSQADMNRHQLSFYKKMESSLDKGNYIDVDGNIGYVFVFLYKLLERWNEDGFDYLYEYLIYLSEIYKHEKKISYYCLHWASDCLLGLEKYEEYLDKTEPKEIMVTRTHDSNLRLNIQKRFGLPANPIDLLLMVGGRKTQFIANNQTLYKDCIIDVFSEFSKENMEWFSLLEKWLPKREWLPSLNYFSSHSLFNGSTLRFKIEAFYSIRNLLNTVPSLSKKAENKAREIAGVPRIGEGWISETELFCKLEAEFSDTKIIQHGRPTWLGRQHFDIWFPNWKIAVEYHGKQHFEPVEFFGGEEAFQKTVERDKRKVDLSKRHGVKLLIVTETDNQDDIVQDIKNIVKKRKIASPLI